MALMVAPRIGSEVVGLWSVTAVFLGVLIVYATTQPQKVRSLIGGALAAAGVAGLGLLVDQVFYCPDCCGPFLLGFLCWWM